MTFLVAKQLQLETVFSSGGRNGTSESYCLVKLLAGCEIEEDNANLL